MNNIQKAAKAVYRVLDLLRKDEKLSAVGLIEMAYKCSTEDAEEFVNSVETVYDLGN